MRLAAGQVSAVGSPRAAIARIERYDATVNAVCVPDFDRALAAARDADAARARGEVRPLLGVPMTVKESFHIAGLPTTWGIPAFKDFVSDTTLFAVARVKAAGAVVLGKTNVPLGLGDVQSYKRHLRDDPQPVESGAHPRWLIRRLSCRAGGWYGALSLGSDIGVHCATQRTSAASMRTKPTNRAVADARTLATGVPRTAG